MQHAFRGSRRLFAIFSACALVTFAVFSASSSAHVVAKHGRHGHHHGSGGLNISSQSWGSADGQPVNLYTLSNSHGMSVNITNYGGVVQSIWVPDKRGGVKDVALGFSKLSDYVNDFTQGATQTPWPLAGGSGDTYFGAIIGRYANRIANHSFMLNGQTYVLDANNGVNTLHGGYLGWNTAVWTASPLPNNRPDAVGLQLTQTFPAGEGCLPSLSPGCTGFPDTIKATVTYWLTSDNQLQIQYNAKNVGSNSTVINLTNHTYFNLGGEGSGTVYHQLLAINADQYQPVDTNLIPTGFANVAGTAYDFRSLKPIGRDIRRADLPDGGTQAFPQLVIAHGYDNNWVLNGTGYRPVALAVDPKTGIVLTTLTDQPGVQFYSGNFLVGDLVGTSGRTYRQSDGFTLETQHYPDAPHHINDPAWPSVVLGAGDTFTSSTAYAFSVTHGGHFRHSQFK
jgi:aldose 1-epimerase